jgi:hypothetical protein
VILENGEASKKGMKERKKERKKEKKIVYFLNTAYTNIQMISDQRYPT